MDSKKLRENFGLFSTGVCIATTCDTDKSNFITINSFSSVSLDPALLLFSIANKSNNLEAFANNTKFAINILAKDQVEISKIFSKSERSQFNIENFFHKSSLNNLILQDCLGYFECKKHKIIEAGDHNIIIGEIMNFSQINPEKEPLIYFKGKYN